MYTITENFIDSIEDLSDLRLIAIAVKEFHDRHSNMLDEMNVRRNKFSPEERLVFKKYIDRSEKMIKKFNAILQEYNYAKL